MACVALLILYVSFVAAANPRLLAVISSKDGTAVAEPLKPRTSACTEINAEGGSVPYMSYYNGQPGGCPIINALDADGTCSSHMTSAVGGECSAYCEVRNYFTYGQEVPFPSAACDSNDPCSIGTTHTVTVTQSFSFNLGGDIGTKRSVENVSLTARDDEPDDDPIEDILKATFNAGASFEFTTASSTSVSTSHSRPANDTGCGYWTAVPVFMTSCGTLTTAPITTANSDANSQPTYRRAENSLCDDSKKVTTPNWCNTTPLHDSTGNQQARTVYVQTHCIGNALLPACMQDPVFQYPGVARAILPSC